jgi:fumarate hydratase class II
MVTVLAPIIGYKQAAALAKEASASGRTIREVALERSGIPSAELGWLLAPRCQT